MMTTLYGHTVYTVSISTDIVLLCCMEHPSVLVTGKRVRAGDLSCETSAHSGSSFSGGK